MTIEDKLASLGIKLPSPPSAAGSYVPIVITHNNLVFLSGQIPTEDGVVKFRGKVGRDLPTEAGQQAARLCTINALSQLKLTFHELEKIRRIVKVTGFVNSDPSFTDQSKVVNGASDLLLEIFGEKGKHARSAVGVTSLPLDSAVEVEFVVEI